MSRAARIPKSFDTEEFPISTALFEAVEQAGTVQSRISAAKKLAMCLTVTGERETARAAAAAVGTSEGALYNLRRSENGKKYEREAQKLLLSGEGRRAIGRIVQIARQKENIPQAMRANEWLTGVNGLSPAQRHEVEHIGAAPQVGMMVIHPDALPEGGLEALIPLRGDSKSPPHDPQVIEHEAKK